jgi:biotin carboxyl carrier protein
MDIKINDRTATVTFLEKKDNLFRLKVDQKVYEVDIVMVGDLIYSLLHQGESFNIEMIQGSSPYHYDVNTLYNSYKVEILDQAAKLKLGRSKDDGGHGGNQITTPMPAKIVKVLVKEGESVKKGQTLLVVSAMKMEIEHKAPRDCHIKKIRVNEDDTVNVNEVLIDIE